MNHPSILPSIYSSTQPKIPEKWVEYGLFYAQIPLQLGSASDSGKKMQRRIMKTSTIVSSVLAAGTGVQLVLADPQRPFLMSNETVHLSHELLP